MSSSLDIEVVEEAPPTLRSVEPSDIPRVEGKGPGRKDDGGKIRADLLPAGALGVVATQFAERPISGDLDEVFTSAASWRRNGTVHALARASAELLVLLSRDALASEISIVDPIWQKVVCPALLPACSNALLAVAQVMTFGAAKYGPNNWQNVTPFKDRYYAAFMRHILARCNGETHDVESKLRHLAHAACCLLFLLSGEVGHDPT